MEKQQTGNYRRAAAGAIYEPGGKAKSANDLAGQQLWVARFLAELLDHRFVIPGTSIRIGLDPILGLVPGIGDLLANLTGSAILFIAAQFNLPKIVLLRMGLNIAINALIGAIPILGDIFSIWFRSNVKNVQLLEHYASGPRRTSTAADWAFVIALIAALMTVVFAILVGVVWLVSRLTNLIS